jgi:replicative DNA helicase
MSEQPRFEEDNVIPIERGLEREQRFLTKELQKVKEEYKFINEREAYIVEQIDKEIDKKESEWNEAYLASLDQLVLLFTDQRDIAEKKEQEIIEKINTLRRRLEGRKN